MIALYNDPNEKKVLNEMMETTFSQSKTTIHSDWQKNEKDIIRTLQEEIKALKQIVDQSNPTMEIQTLTII